MKQILITGGKSCGKSHIMLCLARIMTNAGLNVLVVDATKFPDILGNFELNHSMEDQFILEGPGIITREGFGILSYGAGFDNKVLNNKNLEDIDIVLIETDYLPHFSIGSFSNIIFVQDMDIGNLNCLKSIIHKLSDMTSDVENSSTYTESTYAESIYMLNNYIPCKLSVKYISNTLGISAEEFQYIPFDTKNILNSINQKVDGRFKLKGYTKEHNKALFKIFCKLIGIDYSNRNFKKLMY